MQSNVDKPPAGHTPFSITILLNPPYIFGVEGAAIPSTALSDLSKIIMDENSSEEKLRFLGIFGIIWSAIRIPFYCPSFIAFTAITSLPFFCVMLVPKLPFVPTWIMETLYLLQLLSSRLGVVGFLLVWLVDTLAFLATVTVNDSASAIYNGGAVRSMGLCDLLRNSSSSAVRKWHRSLFAFLVTSLLSSWSLEAVIFYGDSGPLRLLRHELFQFLHFITHVGVSLVRDKFMAWLQVGLVVSVLEEDKSFEPFCWPSKLRKGNRFRGFVLMLLYFCWSSLPYVLVVNRWSFTSGLAYAFFDTVFCLGKVMNWVVCTIYYHDCKNRH